MDGLRREPPPGRMGQDLRFALGLTVGGLPVLFLDDPARRTLNEPGEEVSALLASVLGAGFALALSPEDLEGPLPHIGTWLLAADEGGVWMYFPGGFWMGTDPEGPIAAPWLDTARRTGRVVVAAGRLGLPTGDINARLTDAAGTGMLTAATLPFRPADQEVR